VDIALNITCRLITGCLLAGIPPTSVRRLISTKIERGAQIIDIRHPMHDQNAPTLRLKTRKFFLKISKELSETTSQSRISEWKTQIANMVSK